jgi:hypothetical protein
VKPQPEIKWRPQSAWPGQLVALAAALLLTLLPVHSGAQAPSASAAGQGQGQEHTVSLKLQERASVDGLNLNIHFVGYRDERCPSDVQCVWAGEAQAFFWMSGAGQKPQIVALRWDGAAQPLKHTVRFGPYSLYLRSLEPRPVQASPVSPGAYRAVLQVVR